MFLCICDGHLMAYDSEFFQHLTTLVESKGCHLFAVNERQSSIALVIKKKLYLYFWQQSTFILRKEFSLQDVPKTIYFHQCGIIIGYRRFYESIDPATGLVTRILDFEKEHKMVCFEVEILCFSDMFSDHLERFRLRLFAVKIWYFPLAYKVF